MTINEAPHRFTSYVGRVTRCDTTRKGLAAAVAGVLISIVSEAIWPSRS